MTKKVLIDLEDVHCLGGKVDLNTALEYEEPADGEEIFVKLKHNDFNDYNYSRAEYINGTFYSVNTCFNENYDCSKKQITHWMPIQPLPEVEG